MYREYLGRELYNKIEHLVDNAFHKIYTSSENNIFQINTIKMDYSVIEDLKFEVPLIFIDVSCSTFADGEFEVTMDYFLDETDEYNIGRMTHQFEIAIDEE